MRATTGPNAPSAPRILLYSDDRTVRDQIRFDVGPRLTAEGQPIEWHEVATPAAVIDAASSQRWDLIILDGEAAKAGGMGIARQLKNEVKNCPPCLVLISRKQDAWLASWSLADATVVHPLNPIEVRETVSRLLGGQPGED